MKRHVPIGLTLVILLAITYGTSLALMPERDYRAIPSDYGIIYRDVDLHTSDGLNLKGWFFPAQDTLGISNSLVGRYPIPEPYRAPVQDYQTLDDKKRRVVVVCNGDAGNMTSLILYAYHLFTRGSNVLLFDWRGFGESDDWPLDPDQLCYTEFLTDYEAAIQFVKSQPEVDSNRIGVFGFSTGAYLSFAIAAGCDDVRAFAGRALMTSFEDVAPGLKKLAPDRPLLLPEDYPGHLLPIEAARTFVKPALLVVGSDDDRTPPSMSRKIYDRLGGSKELWIVEGAGHGGSHAPEYINYPEFFLRLAEFFEEYL